MSNEKKLLFAFGAGAALLVAANFVSGQREHRRDVDARLAAIEAQLGDLAGQAEGLGARVGELAAAETAPASEVTALGEDVAALAARIEALGQAQGDLAGRAESGAAAVAALGASVEERIGALAGRLDAELAAMAAAAGAGAGAAPADAEVAALAPAEAVEDTAAAMLAAMIGEGGLALSPGQSGMAGDARVVLTRQAGPDAVLRVAGLGDVRVGPDSGVAALDNGCTLGLAGFAGRTAYLTVACEGGAAVAAAPAEMPAAEADPVVAALTAAIGPGGLALSPGTAGTVGKSRLFFVRRADEDAVLRVAGGDDIRIGPATGPVEVAEGCSVSLAGFAGRTAYIAADCGGEGGATQVAAVETASDADGSVALAVGETATIGGSRVFFSRRAGENVVLQVAGLGQVQAGPTAGTAEIGECTVSLVGFDGGRAVLKPDC